MFREIRSRFSGGDFVHGPATANTGIESTDPICVLGEVIFFFDQQPVLIFFAGPGFHADQGPFTFESAAVENKFQAAGLEAFSDILALLRFPGTFVPEHHGSATVLAFGDGALEILVVIGMIFDGNGKALIGGVVGGAFRYRPTQ